MTMANSARYLKHPPATSSLATAASGFRVAYMPIWRQIGENMLRTSVEGNREKRIGTNYEDNALNGAGFACFWLRCDVNRMSTGFSALPMLVNVFETRRQCFHTVSIIFMHDSCLFVFFQHELCTYARFCVCFNAFVRFLCFLQRVCAFLCFFENVCAFLNAFVCFKAEFNKIQSFWVRFRFWSPPGPVPGRPRPSPAVPGHVPGRPRPSPAAPGNMLPFWAPKNKKNNNDSRLVSINIEK